MGLQKRVWYGREGCLKWFLFATRGWPWYVGMGNALTRWGLAPVSN